jgi:hypothetical protein
MDAININYVDRQANYRLRGAPVKLFAKTLQGVRPDGDGWEEVWDESWGTNYSKSVPKMKGSRKQAAARCLIPRESIRIVAKREAAPLCVVEARLANKTAEEVRIAELEAKVSELMGLLQGGK